MSDKRSTVTVDSRSSKSSKTSKSTTRSRLSRRQHINLLAIPKADHRVPLPKRPQRPLEQMIGHIEQLAVPKERSDQPGRPLGLVSPNALVYEITQPILKLATQVPKRFTEKQESIIIGQVKPAALKAQATDRVKELAAPKTLKEGSSHSRDESEIFSVKPSALNYIPSRRIKVLARPKAVIKRSSGSKRNK